MDLVLGFKGEVMRMYCCGMFKIWQILEYVVIYSVHHCCMMTTLSQMRIRFGGGAAFR